MDTLLDCKTKKEALHFVNNYRKFTRFAEENLLYGLQIEGSVKAKQIGEWLGIKVKALK